MSLKGLYGRSGKKGAKALRFRGNILYSVVPFMSVAEQSYQEQGLVSIPSKVSSEWRIQRMSNTIRMR